MIWKSLFTKHRVVEAKGKSKRNTSGNFHSILIEKCDFHCFFTLIFYFFNQKIGSHTKKLIENFFLLENGDNIYYCRTGYGANLQNYHTSFLEFLVIDTWTCSPWKLHTGLFFCLLLFHKIP